MRFALQFLFEFCIAFGFWSQYYSHSDEQQRHLTLAQKSDAGPLEPSLYFDLEDPQWLTFIGQFAQQGMDNCPLNTDALNTVRVCTRAQFYGPAGLEAMKRSGELYAEHRNDKMLVLVSGCLLCPSGFGQGEIVMKLVQMHPEGSMLTACYQAWEEVGTIKIPVNFTSAPIPFIIGAVFTERRCSWLFSTDALRKQFYSHFLHLEGVQCGASNPTREIPLQKIHTIDYENRALEYVFAAPLDLSRTDRNLRMTQIWGVPPERGQSKRLRFSDIDCGRVLANDVDYIKQRRGSAAPPVTFADPGVALPVDCASIRSRYFHFTFAERKYKNGSGAEDYPLAFVRLVYQSYLFIEMEFASSYAPQNYYCYAIDKKSSDTFRRQIHALAICFPNVLVVQFQNEYDMDSKGHNHMKSWIECMKLLLTKNEGGNIKWKYAILLQQNDDVQIKTNDELVQIFKWMNGVNDIQYTRIGSVHVNFETHNWSLSHLKLFKNETKNRGNLVLKKSKGHSQMSLTREFVEWLLNDLDVSIMLDQLNSYDYASDEYFIQTLAANEFMGAPGGFTHKCFDKDLAPGFTRMTIWTSVANDLCHSGIIRHGICMLGLKDLVPNLSGKTPFLFANKMQLQQDAEAVQCWHETMFNRTYLDTQNLGRLNKSFYAELPQVRYNLEKRRSNGALMNADTFNCRYAFFDEVKQYQELNSEYTAASRSFKSAADFQFCDILTDDALLPAGQSQQQLMEHDGMAEDNGRTMTTKNEL